MPRPDQKNRKEWGIQEAWYNKSCKGDLLKYHGWYYLRSYKTHEAQKAAIRDLRRNQSYFKGRFFIRYRFCKVVYIEQVVDIKGKLHPWFEKMESIETTAYYGVVSDRFWLFHTVKEREKDIIEKVKNDPSLIPIIVHRLYYLCFLQQELEYRNSFDITFAIYKIVLDQCNVTAEWPCSVRVCMSANIERYRQL